MSKDRMTRLGQGSTRKGFPSAALPKSWSNFKLLSGGVDVKNRTEKSPTIFRKYSSVEKPNESQISDEETVKSKSWIAGQNYRVGSLSKQPTLSHSPFKENNIGALPQTTVPVSGSLNILRQQEAVDEKSNRRRKSSPSFHSKGHKTDVTQSKPLRKTSAPDRYESNANVIRERSTSNTVHRFPARKTSVRTTRIYGRHSDIGHIDSSSEEESHDFKRERKPTRSSTPDPIRVRSIAHELNSPVLQRKLQKALTKRSQSDNNFHRRTRKIRLEGFTYKLTMEPPDLSVSSSEESKSPPRAVTQNNCKAATQKPIPRQISRNDRSTSLPETEFPKHTDNKSVRSHSLTSQEMMQARKWVSEREEVASKIDLSRPIRLPPTEQEMNGTSDNEELILPCVDRREALDCAALRLRRISQELEKGDVSTQTLKDTLQYAISVLEMKFLNRTSYSDDDSDADASLQGDSVVPPEIKRWLMQTFSTSGADGKAKRKGDRRTLRSVVHVMQAGMFVERMFRKSSAATNLNISPEIQCHLKDIDKWQYDVFSLEAISGGNALKFALYEVLSKYDFIRKYKISPKALFAFADKLQLGYRKHNNRYHNPIHAADVTQCISVFLSESGFVNWLSDLEMFAMIFAGAIHDLEHTGTTNNFHTQTRSNLALLYNDKSVLENHHASAAFKILWEDRECDILSSLSKEDYKHFRELVIEMVLATDMSLHFGQIKNMKAMLQHPEKMERSKAMALMMHCADINHPTRPWELHHRWTSRLLEEFFEQGDKERELQLPISPLCDRRTTMVAQSQIGFIDYVIKPTFDVLYDLFWKISVSSSEEPPGSSKEKNGPTSRPTSAKSPSKKIIDGMAARRYSEAPATNNHAARNKESLKTKITDFRNSCTNIMKCNRQKWVVKDKEEQEAKKSEESSEQSMYSSSTNSDNGPSPT